jgi:hypothetical protein
VVDCCTREANVVSKGALEQYARVQAIRPTASVPPSAE